MIEKKNLWAGVDLGFYSVHDIIASPFLPGGWENVGNGGRQVPLREQEVAKQSWKEQQFQVKFLQHHGVDCFSYSINAWLCVRVGVGGHDRSCWYKGRTASLPAPTCESTFSSHNSVPATGRAPDQRRGPRGEPMHGVPSPRQGWAGRFTLCSPQSLQQLSDASLTTHICSVRKWRLERFWVVCRRS